MSLRLAVFASGGGSNLQALIDYFHSRADDDTEPAARVVLVISDREDAGALQRARESAIDAVHVEVIGRPTDLIGRELLAILDGADVDLIALAGYLQLIPPAIIHQYRNRIVNIHPALLPAFSGKGMYGMRVHRAVIDAGATVSGPTVHLVTENYDEGPIIAQWPVPVLFGDTADELADRVLATEHLLYPAVIEAMARALGSGRAPGGFIAPQGCFHWSGDPSVETLDIRRALGTD